MPNLIGVKDAAGSPGETARLLAVAPAGYEVYCGDDALTLPFLSVGAVGLIGVATHWAAPEVVAMFDAWEAGDTARARQLNALLLDSWDFETGDESPNPGPAKAMLRHLGRPAGTCRPPMGADPEWLDGRAAEVIANLRRRPWTDAMSDERSATAHRSSRVREGAGWLIRSGWSSSAGWGRSGATAWPSSRASATTDASCSSTAG